MRTVDTCRARHSSCRRYQRILGGPRSRHDGVIVRTQVDDALNQIVDGDEKVMLRNEMIRLIDLRIERLPGDATITDAEALLDDTDASEAQRRSGG